MHREVLKGIQTEIEAYKTEENLRQDYDINLSVLLH